MTSRTVKKNSLRLGLRWSSNCGLGCSWHGELYFIGLKNLVLGRGMNDYEIASGEVAGLRRFVLIVGPRQKDR